MLALDEALAELAKVDAAKATLVELKFFGGMTMEEIAAHVGKPIRTLEREWAFARAWLYQSLVNGRAPSALE